VRSKTSQVREMEMGRDQMLMSGTTTILMRSWNQDTSMNAPFPDESGRPGFRFR